MSTISTFHFDSTKAAYDAAMTRDDIKTGDVLVIKPESVVGLADTWPVAVTHEAGEFHHVRDALTLEAYGFEPESVDHAEHVAARYGWPLKSVIDPDGDTTWFDEIKADADRQQNQRSTDSEITAAILEAEPSLSRAQFRKAIRKLERYFETAMDATGPQKARRVLERIHQITGDRRRKSK